MSLNTQCPDVESRIVQDFELEEFMPINSLQEDIPPNGGYGWVCTLGVFLINAHTWGINSTWAIFLSYYLSHSTFPNATHLQYAIIGGLALSQALIMTPIVAMANRHFGIRSTLIFGSLLAVGIASSGVGIGGLVYNLLTGYLIDAIGVQQTYRVLASCSVGANIVSSLLLKDWKNITFRIHERTFNLQAYSRIEVLLLIIWGVLTELGYVTLLYSLPSYAMSVGLTSRQGSVVGALLSLGSGFGRPIVGYLSDKFGRINIASFMTALCGLFCFALWIPAKSYGILLTFSLLAGTTCGTFWGTVGPVTAEVVGIKRLTSVFGFANSLIFWISGFTDLLRATGEPTASILAAEMMNLDISYSKNLSVAYRGFLAAQEAQEIAQSNTGAQRNRGEAKS
ncbi:hypothetical protein B7463_g3501, partial [Scytalidium lignicola]